MTSKVFDTFLRAHENMWTRIKFTKVDGTLREMVLVPKNLWGLYAPPSPTNNAESGSATKRKRSQGVTTVLEKDNGWRSFRNESLVDFEVIPDQHK